MNPADWVTAEKQLKETGIRLSFNGNLARGLSDLMPKTKKFDNVKTEYLKDVQELQDIVDDYLSQLERNKARAITDPAKTAFSRGRALLLVAQKTLSDLRNRI